MRNLRLLSQWLESARQAALNLLPPRLGNNKSANAARAISGAAIACWVERLECRMLLSGYAFNQITSFPGLAAGYDPTPAIVVDSHGNIFGISAAGGTYNQGTVYEIAHGASSATVIASFNGTNGSGQFPASPFLATEGASALVVDSNGNIFGTTGSGGSANQGTFFEIAHGTSSINVLANFSETTDSGDSSVAMGPGGELIVTDGVTIMEMASGSTTLSDLATLPSGSYLTSNLVVDASGNIFGASENGNTFVTSLFEIPHGTSTINTLGSFSADVFASTNMVTDSSGDVFVGTSVLTESGPAPGTTLTPSGPDIHEIVHGSNALVDFDAPLGDSAAGALAVDSSGNLFGITASGGTNDAGTLFEIALGSGSSTAQTLASFVPATGDYPLGLITDSNGNLFGTVQQAANSSSNLGAIFEVAHGTTTINTVADFTSNDNSPLPNSDAGLMATDSSGDVFGTTSNALNQGTIFEIASGTTSPTTFATFNAANGGNPYGLTFDSSGDLFGFTRPFQTNYYNDDSVGTVFEIAHGTTSIITLGTFTTPGTVGVSLVADSSGDLFGITGSTASGAQTVFEISHGTTTINTLLTFNGTNGEDPAALAVDPSGDIFGTTSSGGASGYGTLFEIVHGTSTVNILSSLQYTDARISSLAFDSSGDLFGAAINYANVESPVDEVVEMPEGSSTFENVANVAAQNLVVDSHGNLFGTIYAASGGSIFEIFAGTTTPITLATFNGANGSNPLSLAFDSQGDVFGETASGGTYNDGTLFELVPQTPTVSVADSGGPYTGSTYPATALVDGSTSPLNGVYPIVAYYTGSTASGTPSYSAPSAAGTYTVVATYPGSPGYDPVTSSPVTFTIGAAAVTPTITVSDPSGPYTGSPYYATAKVDNSTSALNGIYPIIQYYTGNTASGTPSYTAPTASGTYTVVATYPGSPGYNSVTSAPVTFTIGLPAPTVTVSDAGGTYTGSPFWAEALVNGSTSALDGVYPVITYYVGNSVSGTPSYTAPSAVGTYTVVATYPGSAQYASATSAPVTFTITPVITKSTPTVVVSDPGGIYTGSPFWAEALVNGSTSPLEGVYPVITYYVGSTVSGTPSYTAPTAVGTYTVIATFPGSTDYNAVTSNPVTFTITAAG